MKKRIISIILSVVMLVSLLPTTALAADTNEHTTHSCDASCGHIDGDPHKTMSASGWTGWDGTTNITYDSNNTAYVYLSAEAQRDSVLTVASGKTLNLCLNGNTLNLNGKYINVEKTATLNLCDCASSEGKITGGAGFTQNNFTYGGGVYNLGTFNMYGGKISNNTAQYGGGVYNGDFLTAATFNMYGGTISGNSGNGVYNNTKSTFTMSGGQITGNTGSYGGGLYNGNIAKMTGGIIGENTADTKGGGVYNSGSFEMSGGKIINNKVTGTDKNSNGHGGGICTNVNSSVTQLSGTAEISGNTAEYYGGGVCNYNGTLTIDGAAINNNTSKEHGGGVYTTGTCTTMLSGAITGNSATNNGGGVYANSQFIMQGGEISSNAAGQYGGGVYSYPSLTQISGGTITGNSAKYGGGFSGSGTISGGTITSNTATSCGGGVHASTGLTLSGSPVISGNTTNSVADNVYLGKNIYSNDQITMTVGTMSSGASIGVTMFGGTGVVSSGGASYVSYFSSDNSAYTVDVDGNNLKLAEPPAETHSHYNCGVANCTTDHNGDASGNGHSEVDSWIPLSTVLTYDSESGTYNGTLSSGNYYLDKDMTVKGTSSYNNDFCIDIQGTAETPAHVNLCLNGHQLKGSSGDVILHVSGGTDSNNASLSICDCYDAATHTGAEYTHTYTSPISGEAKTVTGGLVTGAVGGYARTMYANCAQVNIYGGTFAGNGSGKTGGGALYMSGAVLRFYDGSITDNYVSSGGMLSMQNAEAHLIGGSVTGNAAYYGVTGNYEDDGVGGVHLFGESTAAIHSGFDISENFAGLKDGEQIDSNLLLGVKPTDNSDLYITLTGPRDTPIGIRMYEPGVFTSGFGTVSGASLNDFVCEQRGYFLATEGEGDAAEAKLEAYAITTQPTTEDPQVATNKDSDIASYSWHSQASEVVDETSATAQTYYNSTCTDGVWSGTPKGSGYYIDFFKMELKAGDTLTATLVNNDYFDRIVLAGMVTGDTSIDKDGTTYVFEITADDTYTLGVAQAMDANPTFSVVRSSVGDAISGQTTATLTDGTDGETYVCKVSPG